MVVNLNKIIDELKQDKVVCVPTDTVYGLITIATESNRQKLAKLKENDGDKQYTIMVKDKEEALQLWTFNPLLKSVVKKHFPGALTIIAPQKSDGKLLGIRIPNNENIIKIIKMVGPIFATSTNKSKKPPLNNVEEIKQVFPNLSILEGKCGNQMPSTIAKITDLKIEIIRQGDIFV